MNAPPRDRILYNPPSPPGWWGARRRSRRSRWGVFAIISILAALAAGIYILRHPSLQINSLVFSGLETINEEAIRTFFERELAGNGEFIPPASFFALNPEEMERKLQKNFPKLAAISIHKKFPRFLTISVKERKLWGILCDKTDESRCIYLDQTGFAYESAPSSSGALILKVKKDAPELKIGASLLEAGLMETLEKIRFGLKEALGLEVVGFELFTRIPGEVRAQTSEGFWIYFDRHDDLEKTLKVLKIALEEEIKGRKIKYLDARFGNKIFYK